MALPTDPSANGTHPEAGILAVLEFLARAVEVPIDPTRSAQCVRNAIRDVPPTQARASRVRMALAAEAVGLQVLTRQLSVREALAFVAYETPLAVYPVTPDGSARWFVLAEARGGQGRLVRPAAGDTAGDWLAADDLARELGADDADRVIEWLAAQPAAPMAETRAGYDDIAPAQQTTADDHAGHGHGHAPHEHHGPPPFWRLLGLLRPEARDLKMVVLFAVGVGIFSLATPIAAMAVVNSIALISVGQQLAVVCVMLFAALSLAAFLRFYQGVVVEYIQRRVFVRVAADLAYRLPRVDLRAFDRQHGPELVNRFFDVLTVQKAAATLLVDGVTLGLQVLIGMLLLGYYHQMLLGFDLVLIASLAFLFFVLGRGGVRTAVRESIAKYRVAGWLQEVASHPVAFKFAGGPRHAAEQTDVLTREYLLARSAHFVVLVRQAVFALFLQALANTALLAVGGYLVIKGELTLGQLVAAEIVVTLVVASFTKLGKQLEAYYDLLAAVDKLGHLTDLPLERAAGEPHRTRTRGAAVAVHDVSFTYEGTHRPALSHLSVRLDAGARVALVGPNGAGKTTLVDLLFGLRPPTDGWVEFDGYDLRDLKLESVREHVAVVKRIEIFEGSVLDNVRMGREDVSVADVRDALRRVGLLDSVQDLPGGLNTMLWPGGAPLSLGQANRLMLARAIVGQPRLLILDETLDHMDSDIRETVLPAILGREARWTLLVVTHSEEVAKLCDSTVRLERSRPVAAHH